MDNESHKKTWDNFTKFVLWGTVNSNWRIGSYGNFFIVKN